MDKAWAAGIPHITFTGGEPTLRDDLPALIAHAEKIGQVTGLLIGWPEAGRQGIPAHAPADRSRPPALHPPAGEPGLLEGSRNHPAGGPVYHRPPDGHAAECQAGRGVPRETGKAGSKIALPERFRSRAARVPESPAGKGRQPGPDPALGPAGPILRRQPGGP